MVKHFWHKVSDKHQIIENNSGIVGDFDLFCGILFGDMLGYVMPLGGLPIFILQRGFMIYIG